MTVILLAVKWGAVEYDDAQIKAINDAASKLAEDVKAAIDAFAATL